LTPWIAMAEISYLLGYWELYTDFYHSLFDLPSSGLEWSKEISWASTTIMGISVLLAAKEYTVALAKAKIYKKQGFNTFWIFLIAFILLSILIPEKALTFLFMAQIPLSVLFTNYLQYLRKRWVLEVLLWILILLNLLSPLLHSL